MVRIVKKSEPGRGTHCCTLESRGSDKPGSGEQNRVCVQGSPTHWKAQIEGQVRISRESEL